MTVILSHKNCPDGYGAGYWLQRNLPDSGFHQPVTYGDPVPVDLCRDTEVFLVDFCFPAEQLRELGEVAKTVTILDHHQSADGYVNEAGWQKSTVIGNFIDLWQLGGCDRLTTCIDQTRSGVGLVSEFVRRQYGHRPPDWFASLERRDLWKHDDEDQAIFAAVTSRPYGIGEWDDLVDVSANDLYAEGRAIERYRQQLIEQCLENAFRHTFRTPVPPGVRGISHTLFEDVWVANCPYAICSDVAGELAKRDPIRLAATFFQMDETHRKWSLRSTPEGVDVAEVAAHWPPGGGHKHAAGFMEEIPR